MELVSLKEKKILGALYKHGQINVGVLAKITLINRTTLYPLLENLEKKGLVEKTINNEVQSYRAIPLSDYQKWAQQQQLRLAGEVAELEDWITSQKKEPQDLYSEVRYFNGIENIKKLYEDTWRNNEGKIIYAITDYDNAYKILNDFLEKEYFPDRIKKAVAVRSILSDRSVTGKKDISREKKLLREMKRINILNDLGIEINIYDDKISLIAFDEKEPTGIMIKNKLITNAFKNIFEYIWKDK